MKNPCPPAQFLPNPERDRGFARAAGEDQLAVVMHAGDLPVLDSLPEIIRTGNSKRETLFICLPLGMDCRGRAFDNVFYEHLWRSVRYETICLNHCDLVRQLENGLTVYFDLYNIDSSVNFP